MFAVAAGVLLALVAACFLRVMKSSLKLTRDRLPFAGVFGFFAVHVLRTQAR